MDGASKNKHATQSTYKTGEFHIKVAITSDDAEIISACFGQAQYFLVYTVENGKTIGQETRNEPSHKHPDGEQRESHGSNKGDSQARHVDMIGAIMDCDVTLACGMGKSTYEDLKIRRIQPIITDICEVQPTLDAYLNETLTNHLDL